jgi:pimeloyl-ACP methyl ester carboxylesterase
LVAKAHPVVLLHPPGMDSRLWLGQFSALMPEHLVIAPDQRGHGGSTPPSSSYDPVEDVGSVMAATGVRAAAFVGLDEGAEHAVRLACAHPELVFALVLVAPVLKVFVREAPDFYERGQQAMFKALHDEEFAPLLSSIATGDMEALADGAMDRIEVGRAIYPKATLRAASSAR